MEKKILIANRGEIAVCIIQAARELGYTTIAVYSEVDKTSLHVRMADEAYLLGSALSSESYLSIRKILEIAKRSKASAIHPGCGFLAENADFSRACREQGVVFIGPNCAGLELMGDKVRSREHVKGLGIPVLQGTPTLRTLSEASEHTRQFSYPVILKANYGGGGKGMHLINSPDELSEFFRRSQNETRKSFGSEEIFIEEYLTRPRHIEVQLFGHNSGRIVHLGSRECSIQRRYQKVLEEACAPNIPPDIHDRLIHDALKIAQSLDYRSLGTVEFLLEPNGAHYFLEMNPRLQVEHPVTEWVTGLDLVQMQLLAAENNETELKQDDIRFHGHAIEVRVCAEDVEDNFLPFSGTISSIQWPSGRGIRHDSSVESGSMVTTHYDSLLAKISVHAPNRVAAIERLGRALSEVRISGIKTNLPFLRELLTLQEFLQGNSWISLVEDLWRQKRSNIEISRHLQVAASALFHSNVMSSGKQRGNEYPLIQDSWWESGLPK